MARVTKLRESAVEGTDIVTEVELSSSISDHLTTHHSITSTPLIALPYYYDSVRMKYLSHEKIRLVYDTSSTAVSNTYLNLFDNYSSGTQGFDVHGQVYCLVEVEYRNSIDINGVVFYIRDNNNLENILYTNDIGLPLVKRYYNDTLNQDLPNTSELGVFIGVTVQDKPIVVLGLRRVYVL